MLMNLEWDEHELEEATKKTEEVRKKWRRRNITEPSPWYAVGPTDKDRVSHTRVTLEVRKRWEKDEQKGSKAYKLPVLIIIPSARW